MEGQVLFSLEMSYNKVVQHREGGTIHNTNELFTIGYWLCLAKFLILQNATCWSITEMKFIDNLCKPVVNNILVKKGSIEFLDDTKYYFIISASLSFQVYEIK
jgi:hypothetical protein